MLEQAVKTLKDLNFTIFTLLTFIDQKSPSVKSSTGKLKFQT